MNLKLTVARSLQNAVGGSMRLYRASPFYPCLGRMLGRALGLITRYLGPKSVVKEIDGVKFDLDLREVIDASLFYSGEFEADAEKTITAVLKPGMTAVDIGANFGYHTFRMAKAVGSEGKVVAIEPTAWAFDKLQRNAALNDFTNIQYVKAGLGDQDLGPTEVSFQASYRLDGTDLTMKEIVSIDTLDTLAKTNNIGHIDFVKLDVDGFEGKVIRGARQTLAQDHPLLFFEISPSLMRANGDDADELIATLLDLGYELQTDRRERVVDIKAYLAKIGEGFCVNVFAAPAPASG